MAKTDPQRFLPLKTQWFHIMLCLAGGEHVAREKLAQLLIEADLIEESDERPAPELDDARRRYYRLTALGRRVLDAECERLQELVRTLRVKQRAVTG